MMPLNGGREFAGLNLIAVREHEQASIMSAGSFEKTNFGWLCQQLQQQAGEWVELQISKLFSNLPEVNWPSSPVKWDALSWLFQGLFWLILVLLLTWLGLQLWRSWPAVLASLPSRSRSAAGQPPTAQEQQLTADLWRVQAGEFQRQGRYREACRALYMAMLQRLNETGVAPSQLSRTDGEYRQLLQQQPHLQPYQTLIATHERQCFGNAEASLDDVNQCQQAYQEIET